MAEGAGLSARLRRRYPARDVLASVPATNQHASPCSDKLLKGWEFEPGDLLKRARRPSRS